MTTKTKGRDGGDRTTQINDHAGNSTLSRHDSLAAGLPHLRVDSVQMSGDIDRIREALQFIDASDRETWLRMGMAIKSELADAGFDLWEAWSLQAESFLGDLPPVVYEMGLAA